MKLRVLRLPSFTADFRIEIKPIVVLRGILAAIKREERKLEKQLGQTLGGSAVREVVGVKKRVLSAAGRAAIAKAAKKRWAKVRKQAKKVA
jgi:hypothetical protein